MVVQGLVLYPRPQLVCLIKPSTRSGISGYSPEIPHTSIGTFNYRIETVPMEEMVI